VIYWHLLKLILVYGSSALAGKESFNPTVVVKSIYSMTPHKSTLVKLCRAYNIYNLFDTFLIYRVAVQSSSMTPTIHTGDIILFKMYSYNILVMPYGLLGAGNDSVIKRLNSPKKRANMYVLR